jgi:RNA polymerase sigma-70 factor (ECF subfamily)
VVRLTGDLQLAEDVAQETCVAALEQWLSGPPTRATAWLVATARHKAIDRLRREENRHTKEQLAAASVPVATGSDDDEVTEADAVDDQLALILMCCHPALDSEARLALTLRCVAGMRTEDIAALFLVPTPTLAQRLVRAKRKIAAARIPFRRPGPDDFRARLGDVLHVVMLIFTHGHRDVAAQTARTEAIRLARLVTALVPDEPEAFGLLALLLFVDARQGARLDADGGIVTLDRQERARWNWRAIAEAEGILDRAMLANRPGPYQLQAAIAALHSTATTPEATDWRQIALLYSELLRYEPSPVIEANRAVAVAMAEGPAAGLVILDVIAADARLARWPGFHLARADLLRRLGRLDDAAAAYREALELEPIEPERDFVQARLSELDHMKGMNDA